MPSWYRVTVSWSSSGPAAGPIASGLVDGRWQAIGQRTGRLRRVGARDLLRDRRAAARQPSGDPVSLDGGTGLDPLVIFGTLRSDVGHLRVGLNNGQVLTL